ncbi:VOC family protein [Pollutibacter soli]|uniref:VOC family protein n=1 Tax=Pollutibacter soli TaxID=3034157 RepID=UPI00301389F9
MQGAVHHIEIYVSDLKKSARFWSWLLTEKFSYKIFQQWDKGISFKLNESYIVFVQTEPLYISSGYNRKNTGLNHLAFHCDSEIFIDDLTEELKEKVIPVLYPEKHPYAGGKDTYAVYFEDPDRIKVEVVKTNKT